MIDFYELIFLIKHLKSLKPKVVDNFSRFLGASSSPKRRQWQNLLNFLLNLYPEFPEDKLKPSQVHDQIYLNEPNYHNKSRRVRDAGRELKIQIFIFLFIKKAENKPLLMAQIQAEILEDFGWDKKFFKLIQQTIKNTPPAVEQEYHWGLARLNAAVLLASKCRRTL